MCHFTETGATHFRMYQQHVQLRYHSLLHLVRKHDRFIMRVLYKYKSSVFYWICLLLTFIDCLYLIVCDILLSCVCCYFACSMFAGLQAAPTIWNDLPLDSRSAATHERFRSATKKHFYELAFMNWSRDCLRSHDSFLATTYGALSNTYNNNNNNNPVRLSSESIKGNLLTYLLTYS